MKNVKKKIFRDLDGKASKQSNSNNVSPQKLKVELIVVDDIIIRS